MPIFLAMDLPIGSEVPLQPVLPIDSSRKVFPAMPLTGEGEFRNLPPGAVESFDPVARASVLAETLPRQWCGTYESFSEGTKVDVELRLSRLTAMGQMVDLRGDMRLGDVVTPVQGNLNAKSDQLDLLPLADALIPGVEPGGTFVGLQQFLFVGWEAPRLTNTGGNLNLSSTCSAVQSEPPAIRGLW